MRADSEAASAARAHEQAGSARPGRRQLSAGWVQTRVSGSTCTCICALCHGGDVQRVPRTAGFAATTLSTMSNRPGHRPCSPQSPSALPAAASRVAAALLGAHCDVQHQLRAHHLDRLPACISIVIRAPGRGRTLCKPTAGAVMRTGWCIHVAANVGESREGCCAMCSISLIHGPWRAQLRQSLAPHWRGR